MALKRNLIANYLGQGWVALMGLAFIPLYIKYLGIEAYGLIGLFAVLQAWLSLLDMGMTPTLNREMARFTGGTHSATSIRDLLRSIEIIAVGVAIVIAGVVALGSNWIATSLLKADALRTDVVAQAFAIMGLVAALRFVEGVYRSAIIGLQRQVLFNVLYSIMATLRGLGAVGILVWVSPTIKAFFIWQGAVSMATLAILAITTYVSVPKGGRGGRFSLDALRSVWRFAGGMVLGTLSGLFLSSTDKIFISKYLTLADVGYYTFAATVVSVLGVLLGPVNQAIFPRFAELMAQNARTTLANTFLNASQLISVFLGSIAVVLIVHSYTIIYVWSGDPNLARSAAPIVTLLAIATLVASPCWMLYQAQVAYGLPGIGVKVNIINIIFTLPALFYFIPRYGLQGSACVLVASSVIGLCLHIYYTFGKGVMANYHEWALKAILQPILAGFLVAIPAGLFGFLEGNRAIDALFLLLVFILTVGTSLSVASRIRAVLLLNLRSALFWPGKKIV